MMHKPSIFRQWYFWAILTLFSGLACYFNWTYLPKIYPILHIEMSTDKNQIEKLSQELCKKYNLGPIEYSQSAHFVADKNIEHYIDYYFSDLSSTKKLDQFVQNNLFKLYTWQVRHFKENNPHECLLKFTPEGIPYGFVEQMPENEPGSALTQEEALQSAQEFTSNEWNLDLNDYTLTESSHINRSSGRKDYTFIFDKKRELPTLSSNFERSGQQITLLTPIMLIQALKLKLIICVYGNKISVLDHIVELPDLSLKNYEGFAYHFWILTKSFSSLIILFGYLLSVIICLIGLLILIRKNYLIINSAFLLGILLAAAQLIYQLNAIMDIWITYNTSQSYGAYLLNTLLGYVISFLFNVVSYTTVITITEGLTRAAFPYQVQFWKSLNKQVNSSYIIVGAILRGYLLSCIYLALTNGSYVWAPHIFSWQYLNFPRNNADILAHFYPSLTVLLKSLYESFWNQLFFVALPIAFFTFIGQKLKIRKLGLLIGLIVQLFIFALINSSGVEFGYIAFLLQLISTCLYGLLYINFGLIPGILLQFLYNVILMSLPIFNATGSVWYVQKAIIALAVAIPLIIVIINLLRTHKITELSESYLNASWKPLSNNYNEMQEDPIAEFKLSKIKATSFIVLTILSLAMLYQTISFDTYEPKFTITRDQAIEKAQEYIKSKKLPLGTDWEILSKIISPNQSTIKYIWHHFGKNTYDKLNGTYIKYPLFEVKFIKFGRAYQQKVEEYTIRINTDGKIESFRHMLPEDAPGKNLPENIVNQFAISVASEQFKLDPTILKTISSLEIKRPLRTDWIITIQDTSINFIGNAQAHIIVKICGDEITSINRKIHTPLEWLSYKSKLDQFSIIFGLLKELIFFLFILIAIFQLIQAQKSRRSIILSTIVWLIYLALIIINIFLSIPELTAYLSTGKSFYFQMIYIESLTLATQIFKSLSILIFGMNIFNEELPIQKKLRSLGFINICLGIIAAGLCNTLLLFYKNSPIAYSLQSLNSYQPIASFTITHVTWFISTVLTTLFIARYAKFKFSLKTIFAAFAIAILIISSFEISNLYTHLLIFAIIFTMLLLSHLLVIRYNTALISCILAIMQIAQLTQEYIANPFINSQRMILIACGGVIVTLLVFNMVKVITSKINYLQNNLGKN